MTVVSNRWQPSASLENIRARFSMYKKIRDFFATRGVQEVETPLIAAAAITDPFIEPLQVEHQYYLQTSPEYAMKRLLAADFGSIFQICKAFRKEEQGRLHNTEFTMLEWYQLDFNHHQLIAELIELVQLATNIQASKIITYQTIFQDYINLDPLTCSQENLQAKIIEYQIPLTHTAGLNLAKTDYLDLLFSHIIQPNLAHNMIWVIYDYPAEQAALAKINATSQPPVAERFEVFINGMELANGYHELQDPIEQQKRFIDDLAIRAKLQLRDLPIDVDLQAAMESGLPSCAGVAMGLDRLLMAALQITAIEQVIPFTFPTI